MSELKQLLRIGTRESTLARVQTDLAAAAIKALFPKVEFEIKPVKTKGDKILNQPLSSFGGSGVFVKELEDFLLSGEVDIVIHSMKDLPTVMPDGLELVSTLEREDPRDVLVCNSKLRFLDLKPGARVATSSRRRSAQLNSLRRDLCFTDIRGNIPTRLKKHDDGQCDAMVLAAAGLLRLGEERRIVEFLDPDICMPAAGQGALAIQCRSKDKFIIDALKTVNHQATWNEILAERAFLRELGGGCSVPAGTLAKQGADDLRICASIASLDGRLVYKDESTGPASEAEKLGKKLARKLLDNGAESVIRALKEAPITVSPP